MSPSRRHVMAHWAVALGMCMVLCAAAVTAIALSNGDFSGYYQLSGVFPRAGEGLHAGSEVDYRGVQVGRVTLLTLDGIHARVTVAIAPSVHLPADATATIEPQNLFGAEEVNVTAPGGGPALPPGGVFAHTSTSDNLGQLFAAAAPLLQSVNTANVATIVTEIGQASAGAGPEIARSIGLGAQLASELDRTLQSQLVMLSSMTSFTAVLAQSAPSLNGIATQENRLLPSFNHAVAEYQRLLDNLAPFAQDVATLIQDYRPNIETLLNDGANVSRVLVAHRSDVAALIHGLYTYVDTFAHGVNPEVLPNGTRFGDFSIFVMFSDVNALVCNLIAPAQAGLSYLEPLQQALVGSGTPFNCSSQIARFDALQAQVAGAAIQAPAPPSLAASRAAGQQLVNNAYAAIGSPSTPQGTSLSGYLGMLVGGQP